MINIDLFNCDKIDKSKVYVACGSAMENKWSADIIFKYVFNDER